MTATYVVLLTLYIALMIAISLWFSRASKMRDGEDFVLAGKSLSAFVLASTMLATFVGSGSIIGGANFVYTYGPLAGIFFFLGTFIGILCLLIIAPRVRKHGFRTIPEMFHARFGPAVRTVGTIMILVAFIGITAYQFTGAGAIIALLIPITPAQGTIVAVIMISILALSGGLKSVAWTDVASSVLIAFGLGACLIYIFITDVGGLAGFVDRLDPGLSSLTGGLSPLQLLGYFLPLFMLILGDQNMHQRLAAAKSTATAVKGVVLFFVGAIFLLGPIILLASASSFLLPDIDPDMAILALADSGNTPELLGGILLVSAFALIITTGSSYLLTCSGNVVYDLVFVNKPTKASQAPGLRVGRLSVLGITILAYIMVQFFPSILALQMYAYTMYGAALTPVVLAALFWKRITSAGAMATMIVGAVVTIFWEATGQAEDLNSIVVSLPCAVITLIVVSLATQTRNKSQPPEDFDGQRLGPVPASSTAG